MADSSNIVKFVLVGAAAYLAYELGWLSSLGLAPTAAVAATTTSTTTPATSAAIAKPKLSDIQAAAIILAKAPAAGLGVDDWGYYVNQALAPYGLSAPDPMPLFTAANSAFSRSDLVTSADYWAVMGPALKAQTGLAGLGMYRGGW
jgi:hypothetical protein